MFTILPCKYASWVKDTRGCLTNKFLTYEQLWTDFVVFIVNGLLRALVEKLVYWTELNWTEL